MCPNQNQSPEQKINDKYSKGGKWTVEKYPNIEIEIYTHMYSIQLEEKKKSGKYADFPT